MDQVPVVQPPTIATVPQEVKPKKSFRVFFLILLIAVLVSAVITTYLLLGYKKTADTAVPAQTNPFAEEAPANPFSDAEVSSATESGNPFDETTDDNPFSQFESDTPATSSSYQNPF